MSTKPTIELAPDNLRSFFATPIGSFRLSGLEELNGELVRLVLAREEERSRNPLPSQQIQNEVFESTFDLFTWPAPSIQKLQDIVLAYLGKIIAVLNDYSPEQVERLQIYNDAWFHITRRGGYVEPHNHPNASWSMLYCVQEGEKDTGHEESGALIFHSPRMGSSMHRDPGNMNIGNEHGHQVVKFHLQAGDLMIFPSDIVHSASPYFGPSERITIAANFWFTLKA